MLKRYRSLRSAAALLILLVATSTPVGARQKSQESLAVRQIRAVLDKQVQDWNRRDLEAFMSGYWRSQQLSFYSGGTKTSGWQATLDRYRQRYQSEGREMGELNFSDLQIEMLGPQSAFVRGRWSLKMSTGEQGGLFTLIFRKLPEGWKIVHDHTGSSS